MLCSDTDLPMACLRAMLLDVWLAEVLCSHTRSLWWSLTSWRVEVEYQGSWSRADLPAGKACTWV